MRLLLDCGSGVAHRLAELGLAVARASRTSRSRTSTPTTSRDLATLVFAWSYGDLPGAQRAARAHRAVGIGDAARAAHRRATGLGCASPGFPLDGARDRAWRGHRRSATASTLRAAKVPHTDESVAYSVERGGAAGRLYGRHRLRSDARPNGRAARDVLLCECSLPDAMAIPSHLTPEQCGALAAAAQPRQLVLTHFYPPVERVDIRALVAAHYAGPVTLADDGSTSRSRKTDAGRDGARRDGRADRSRRRGHRGDGLSGAPDARRAAHGRGARRQRRTRRRLAASRRSTAWPGHPRLEAVQAGVARVEAREHARHDRARRHLRRHRRSRSSPVPARWRARSRSCSPRARCARPAARRCAAARSSRAARRTRSRGWASKGLELLALARAETGLADRHRGARRGGGAPRRRVRGLHPDRRAQHAELLAAARPSAASASRCCSSAAWRRRSPTCC